MVAQLLLKFKMKYNTIYIKEIRDKLNQVSPSFCTMKWLNQTLYLHTGDTHSCYHPKPHHIKLEEIEQDPSALHNTSYKKQQRKMMLEGKRPGECYYCWNIEDLPGDHISDRAIHSASDYSVPLIDTVANLPWDQPINPKYLEVSFGNSCNFRCGYCSPQASSMWVEEIKKHGKYDLTNCQYDIDFLTSGSYYGPKDDNPYIEAFWKWWPSLKNDLHTLRITGGEPLMNPKAMQFFELLDKEPAPDLSVSLNSNLGVTENKVHQLISTVKNLLKEKKIKKFSLYTSIDSYGEKAEYMRTGLDCDLWERNLKSVLNAGGSVNLMCTFNILSVTNFKLLLEKIIEWRKEYGKDKVKFDTPYLKTPIHWTLDILTEDFDQYMNETLSFIENNDWFTDIECEKFKRIVNYMKNSVPDQSHIIRGRRDFYVFFKESDNRLGTDFLKTFPEYSNFYKLCQETYERYNLNK